MAFRKIEAGLVQAPVDDFIGKKGTIFYDNDLGDFRISDGSTPGGILLSFSGGGGGGSYTLPTASTSVKGGVKVDGTTITIANQVISVGTVPYSSISGTPTIPTNTNQLTNGSGYITSSALSTYALSSSVPTNTNQLTNGAGYITASALSGYALSSSIPSDLSQLTDNTGLLGQGGGGTTYVTNNIENPFTFSVAGDDSTLREISNGETLQIVGATGITVSTDTEGKFTVTGPDLSGYATQSYVTGQGYITTSSLTWSGITGKPTFATVATSGSYNDLSDKPNIAGSYTLPTATVSTLGGVKIDGQTIQIEQGQIFVSSINYSVIENPPTLLSDFTNDVGYITPSSLSSYATQSYVNSRGYITAQFTFNVAADDSTLRTIGTEETVKFVGAGGITTSSDTEGAITITQGAAAADTLTGTALNSTVVSSSLTSVGTLTGLTINSTSSAPFSITTTGRPGSESNTWSFNSNQSLGGPPYWISFPDNSIQTTAYPGPQDLSSYATLTGEETLTNKTLTSPTITDGVFQTSFTIGQQVFYDQGPDGFSVNENFNITNYNDEENNFTGYHYTSGAGRTGVAFTLARTGQFTDGFGIHGTAYNNEFVIGSETANTNFVFKKSVGMPFDVSGGVPLFSINSDGTITVGDVNQEEGSHYTLPSADGSASQVLQTDGNGTVSWAALPVVPTTISSFTNDSGYATESYVTTRGYLTSVSWNDVFDKPNLAGTYSFSVAADDSTQIEISAGNLVKFRGAGGITTSSDADGNITITAPANNVINANGTLSMPVLTSAPSNLQMGQIAMANGTTWDPLGKTENLPYMIIWTGTAWTEIGGTTMKQVYSAVLEMG